MYELITHMFTLSVTLYAYFSLTEFYKVYSRERNLYFYVKIVKRNLAYGVFQTQFALSSVYKRHPFGNSGQMETFH